MPSVPIGVVFIAIAILAALVVFLFRLHFFVRPLVRLFVRVVYRLRVFDSHNVPREGAVLLVCHSSSFVDWMLLSEACPRRIRFVQWTGGRTTPLLQLFQRMTRSILIDVEAGLVAIEKSRRRSAMPLIGVNLFVCLLKLGKLLRGMRSPSTSFSNKFCSA